MAAGYTIQLRRDTAANWTSKNPVLHQGELGYETDTKSAKLGDGTTAWTSLAYWPVGGSGVSSVNGHSGVVTLAASDVGADASGAASAAQTAAESYASTQASNAQTAAISASLQKASNLSDLANASTARTNLGLGSAATQASSAFDAAGAASAAQAAAEAASVPLAGGTMSGPLVLSADPAVALGAATKQYVDNHAGGGAVTSVNTQTGAVVLTAAEVGADASGAAAAAQAAAEAASLPLTGGTVTGPVSVQAATSGTLLTVKNTTSAPTNPALLVASNAAGDQSVGLKVSGDTFQRWAADSNGKQSWGSGALAADVTLARTAANFLTVSGFLASWSLAPSGLTGAVNNSRYGGAVNGAAPTAGSWILGDWVIDRTNATIWVCTTAGTPGTWTQAGTVTSVTAGDGSIVVGGTGSAPTIEAASIDAITALHPVAAPWSNNGHSITGVATLNVAGNTGATSASRYAGATASGSPASGTWNLGDYIVAQTGAFYICTGAGTPGNWVEIPPRNTTAGSIQAAPGTQAAGSSGTAADAGHVHPQPTFFAPTGLTGATAASRYVGATASGAPSGANPFLLGDFVIDQTGKVWVCTTAGSPGTWTQVGGGGGVTLDTVSTDIQAVGTQAAGSSGLAADAKHVHPTTNLGGDATGAPTANTVGKIQGVAVTAAHATLLAQSNNSNVRSATATVLAGEETVFTGSTAAQTLTLPVTPQVSTINSVTNISSVTVTLAAGAGNTINSDGTVGSIVIPVGGTYSLVFIGTVWYVTNLDQLAVTGTGSTVLAASPALTGNPTATTQAALNNSTRVATTAYADAAVAVEKGRAQTAEGLLAPLASPALTGNPTAPTQAALNNSTRVATTAYADAAVAVAEGLALPKAGGTLTGWLAPAVSALTYATTVLVNAALGNAFNLTLTASTATLGAPSNPVDGQVIRIRVTQGTGGSFTLAYNAIYDFGAGSAPTLSTAAGKVDILAFEYVGSISKWAYLGSGLGY